MGESGESCWVGGWKSARFCSSVPIRPHSRKRPKSVSFLSQNSSESNSSRPTNWSRFVTDPLQNRPRSIPAFEGSSIHGKSGKGFWGDSGGGLVRRRRVHKKERRRRWSADSSVLVIEGEMHNTATTATGEVKGDDVAAVAGKTMTNGSGLLRSHEEVQISSRIPVGVSTNECAGCGKRIRDRFLLKALDLLWHEDCLKCGCCDCRLGEVGSTLYTKANLILCKRDYLRLFGNTGYCAACSKVIPAFEMVMRARNNVYHLECFACQQCNHRFCVGDRFYLCENKILCEYDYQEVMVFANMTSYNSGNLALVRNAESRTKMGSSNNNNGNGAVTNGNHCLSPKLQSINQSSVSRHSTPAIQKTAA
ncbi:uncharacterized protein LOC110851160 isoform X2 [Folsomia candida]|uniref:uncharacterized protein LOC110851160 isoform X2 n=1 Tax=Folsomia candida TaxID=158441 RepID=UPI001604FAFB|nr:uncharacterized protein LOC110851160 isoform X2 [Folsomia candida]